MRLLSYDGYALWIARLLADLEGDKIMTKIQLAERLEQEESFIQQILRRLQAAGLVESTLGVYGGYRLARSAEETTIYAVIDAASHSPRGEAGEKAPLMEEACKVMAVRLRSALEVSILEWPLPPVPKKKK
jgi:Rrf2 family protein